MPSNQSISSSTESSGAKIEKVSFVIPAWNEEDLLPKTITAIHKAAVPAGTPYEIIVADDGSTDKTAQVAKEHGAQVVPCSNRQIAATRNAGARASDGDLLIFVDADTEVSAEAVGAAIKAIREGSTYGGADIQWDGVIPLWTRILLRGTLLMYRFGKLASGAFLFCRRDAFERVGGFDESIFAAEEYYLAKKLKKHGRHTWVKDQVLTSGRKLRTHSASELLKDGMRFLLGGKRILQKREHMGLWYDNRRPDPRPRSE